MNKLGRCLWKLEARREDSKLGKRRRTELGRKVASKKRKQQEARERIGEKSNGNAEPRGIHFGRRLEKSQALELASCTLRKQR